LKPLNPEQAAAVETLLPALRTGGIGSLIGPAGCGKSFTLGHLLPQACALTWHSSQGSTFRSVLVADDLRWCDGPEASALAYVACSRASEALHVLPMSRPGG